MNHAIHSSGSAEGLIHRAGVAHISLHKSQLARTCQFLHPAQRLGTAVVEIVENDKPVPLFQQHHAGVAADESRSAGD